jgi:serine/threonine protein kinase
MTDEQWQRISGIWHAVIARPEEERVAAVDEMCAGDDAMRREVQSLLAHLARADAVGFGTHTPRVAPASLAPGTSLGPYRIQELIGAGGMGVVYRARDLQLKRDVAIKVLPGDLAGDPDRLRRFEQEARSLAALSHANILAVHDIGRREGEPYIVSELLEGATLRERLNESRTAGLPMRKCVDYATQIAR